ncbi:D-alanyl-D-alanine carboxypeptidase [Actinomadura rubrobrunea]|uniref:D-alanyl-D-alanine carboxypeptidase n=1 Tax=Actinomadura rubrobrunea TaxID=115335 RepID=A0A9W6PZF2_9ACTN|nr:D-alanyl-D-alanine carboxypeptidase [Actinomadura rubrobrunea]GLW65751.1 D-alanyl-D-alanine carboxypeptidase [Actinomadura rubrobrunea]
MRRPPRAVSAITVPSVAACLACGLAAPPAAARPAAAGPGGTTPVTTAAPAEPLGGPQLAGKGTIVNPAPGVPAPPKIKAASYLIADGDTGEVLAAKDPHGRYLPASTLKTLTALTLIPRLKPDQTVRPSREACDVEGTKVGMTPKMSYKVSDLFYALMMMSANDAAVALAEANGGMKKTLADMNAEARRINARDTLAGSPNGLDRDLGLTVKTQHTSAYDLVLILREAMRHPDFRRYVQTIDHKFPAPPTKKERKKGKKVGGYPIHTHNRMLPGQSHAYPGMLGGKNGYTIAAKQTFVAAARRGGHTVYISLMGADRPPSPYAAELLDWGFKARGKVKPVGMLVPPGDLTPKKDAGQDDGLLADTPLGGDGPAHGWGLVGGTVAGAVLAAGLVFVVARRRQRG